VDLPSIHQPNPAEAEESLATFRKYMLIFIPFVHLPATMTAERLKVRYPFLWFNIMTISCKNADRRIAMGEAGKRYLAQKMLFEHEKNIDLLLGLVMVMGW
jgi:hypothetical protein